MSTSNTVQKKISTQYIVQTKWRREPDKWSGPSVSFNSRTNKLMWSREEAEYEIERLKRDQECAKRRGYTTSSCGGIGIDCQHYSEYDILAYRIRKREVTPWETDGDEIIVESV